MEGHDVLAQRVGGWGSFSHAQRHIMHANFQRIWLAIGIGLGSQTAIQARFMFSPLDGTTDNHNGSNPWKYSANWLKPGPLNKPNAILN